MKNVPPTSVLSVVEATNVRAVSFAPFTKLATTVDGASAAPNVSAVPVELFVPSAISVAADTVVVGITVVEVVGQSKRIELNVGRFAPASAEPRPEPVSGTATERQRLVATAPIYETTPL